MSGIYIHIPFCKQACHYCNFHFSTSLRYKNEFLDALLKEIELVEPPPPPVETIYFGGGTPSILETEELEAILKKLNHRFGWASDAEITLEANPDDITPQKLQDWKNLGFNRLSIGVRSFYEEDLRWMNRAHNAQQALQSIQQAVQVFPNITVDLIYGSPGLTDEKWQKNMETAVQLGITHISCYALTVEPATPLARLIRKGEVSDVDNDQQSRQFLMLVDYLQANGFEHYEISNFAKPGHRSKHNSAYWKNKYYLGLGPGAHSYDGKNRWWNVANNNIYIRSILEGKLPQEKEQLTEAQQWNEWLMIHLRTMEGIDLEEMRERFSHFAQISTWMQQLETGLSTPIKRGYILQEGPRYFLSAAGKLLADGIAADLFVDEPL